MADNGRGEEFIPSDAQRQMVIRLKAFNTKDEVINKLVLHPLTKKPVAWETFRKTFAEELENAKLIEFEQAISVMKKTMYSENEDLAYKASLKNYQLCSKGLLEPKIVFNKDDTDKQKFDKIVDGVNEGLLSTFDSDSMIKALEVKNKIEIDELHKKVDAIQSKLLAKGIEI